MGASSPREAVLTAYARSLIQFKANQLCRKPGFSRSDQEDLEQEFTLYLLSKAHLYDPNRGAKIDTFADRVVTSAVRILLRDRRRLKRAAGFHTRSLDTLLKPSGEGTGSLLDQIAIRDDVRRKGSLSKAGAERFASSPDTAKGLSRLDGEELQAIYASLPPELQALWRQLCEKPPSGAAKGVGISRRQVANRIAELRTRLIKGGFGPS